MSPFSFYSSLTFARYLYIYRWLCIHLLVMCAEYYTKLVFQEPPNSGEEKKKKPCKCKRSSYVT